MLWGQFVFLGLEVGEKLLCEFFKLHGSFTSGLHSIFAHSSQRVDSEMLLCGSRRCVLPPVVLCSGPRPLVPLVLADIMTILMIPREVCPGPSVIMVSRFEDGHWSFVIQDIPWVNFALWGSRFKNDMLLNWDQKPKESKLLQAVE